jgi:hypothetical protein
MFLFSALPPNDLLQKLICHCPAMLGLACCSQQAGLSTKTNKMSCLCGLQDVSDQYNSLIELVGRGPQTFGERLASCAAMDSFFLCRGKEEVKAMYPVSQAVSGAAHIPAVVA